MKFSEPHSPKPDPRQVPKVEPPHIVRLRETILSLKPGEAVTITQEPGDNTGPGFLQSVIIRAKHIGGHCNPERSYRAWRVALDQIQIVRDE